MLVHWGQWCHLTAGCGPSVSPSPSRYGVRLGSRKVQVCSRCFPGPCLIPSGYSSPLSAAPGTRTIGGLLTWENFSYHSLGMIPALTSLSGRGPDSSLVMVRSSALLGSSQARGPRTHRSACAVRSASPTVRTWAPCGHPVPVTCSPLSCGLRRGRRGEHWLFCFLRGECVVCPSVCLSVSQPEACSPAVACH